MKEAGGGGRAGRPPRAGGSSRRPATRGSDERLDPLGWALIGAWALALVAASPDATALWGLNGFRSHPTAWPALLAAAAAAWALGRFRPRALAVWVAVAAALVLVLAFPWRERIHVLGDTQLRMRALFAARFPAPGESGGSWIAHQATTLHAAPLDLLVDVVPPIALHAAGVRIADAVACVDAVLALAFVALAYRLARRLAPTADRAAPLALALALTGTLEAFAGYADSAALIAVVAMGWWGEALAPLERPSRAWRVTAWFAALVLTHRVGLVMLLPQLLRAVGPAIPGDRTPARRALLALTLGVVALAAAAAFATSAGRQLARDATEILRSARGFTPRPLDVLSALAVVTPLALAAPALAGREGRGFWRTPQAAWVAAGAVPLFVGLLWFFPAGENGLGAHRDWDTNVLLGVTLMVGAAATLARATTGRLDTALSAALPLLVLTALGWVAVNGDEGLATRRAIGLATSPAALTGPQRAHLHVYFGQRAMDERRPDVAALHYQRAFEEGGNPRRALLAAEAWLLAGRPDAARIAIAAARATSPLEPELDDALRRLEAQIPTPDSTAAR